MLNTHLRELRPRRVVAGPVEAVVLFRPRRGLRDDDQLADLAVAQLVRVGDVRTVVVPVREAVLPPGRRPHAEVAVLLVKVELELLLVCTGRGLLTKQRMDPSPSLTGLGTEACKMQHSII